MVCQSGFRACLLDAPLGCSSTVACPAVMACCAWSWPCSPAVGVTGRSSGVVWSMGLAPYCPIWFCPWTCESAVGALGRSSGLCSAWVVSAVSADCGAPWNWPTWLMHVCLGRPSGAQSAWSWVMLAVSCIKCCCRLSGAVDNAAVPVLLWLAMVALVQLSNVVSLVCCLVGVVGPVVCAVVELGDVLLVWFGCACLWA